MSARKRPGWAVSILAVLVGLFGLAMGGGGAILLAHGGSVYYLVTGALLLLNAVLLWRGSRFAGLLHLLIFIGTVLWALSEVGLSFWGLLPRLDAFVVMGALVALASWHMRRREAGTRRVGAGDAALVAAVVGVGLLGVAGGVSPRLFAQIAGEPPVAAPGAVAQQGDWPNFGRDAGGTRFSPLAQITPANVDKLELLWSYRTGELGNTAGGLDKLRGLSTLEATPIQMDGKLFFCSTYQSVIALDAGTGKEVWRTRPGDARGLEVHRTCRGVSYYRQPGVTGLCAARLYHGGVDGRLWAFDSETGKPCPDFGTGGSVDLRAGLSNPEIGYASTSPGAVGGGVIVVGAWISDNQGRDVPSGVIRAYDLVTGKLAWAWDMGHPDWTGAPPAGQVYTPGTPNAWAPLSVDEKLGMVYVPLGNPAPDLWGGDRTPVEDQYGSSVVALDLKTGRPRWHFQTTRHDIWDFDNPSQPVLADVPTAGGMRPGLIQATKRGDIFVLDRTNGKPIIPVTERRVPQGGVPGERVSPTQPFSAINIAEPPLREADMWGISPLDQLWCRVAYRKARYEGYFTPNGLTPWINNPGAFGATSWGGVSVDTKRHLIVANSSNVAFYMQLFRREDAPEFARKRSNPVGYQWVPMEGGPYVALILPFLSPLKVPCNTPPWGFMQAVSLQTGKTVWRHSFGTSKDSGPLGFSTGVALPIGVPNQGGAMTTASGLTFVGASADAFFRAYDTATGKELWRFRLPASAQAIPMTYRDPRSGRQVVVIAAAGHAALATKPGDYMMAFALPKGATAR